MIIIKIFASIIILTSIFALIRFRAKRERAERTEVFTVCGIAGAIGIVVPIAGILAVIGIPCLLTIEFCNLWMIRDAVKEIRMIETARKINEFRKDMRIVDLESELKK